MFHGKFDAVLRDLTFLAEYADPGQESVKGLRIGTAELLKAAQRFYMPGDITFTKGRPYDPALRPAMRLPHEVIALLTWAQLAEHQIDTIVLAVDLQGESRTAQATRQWIGKHGVHLVQDETTWLLAFLGKHPERTGCEHVSIGSYSGWDMLVYGLSILTFPEGGNEEKIVFLSSSGFPRQEFAGGDIRVAVHDLCTLCTLLSLKNVHSHQVDPPAKLNKARVKRGKQPLAPYHVLKVDGEVWDRPHTGTGTGHGVRSHLRRGHIRRLDEERSVWVRATMVHGSAPGFVKKDYQVGTKP